MDFTFSDDQEQLRAAVRRLGAEADADAAWRAAAHGLGLTGIGIAEERGGVGGDFVDAAVVFEEAGRALLPAPLTTALVGSAVLGRHADVPHRIVETVAAGEATAVVGVGDEAGADHVLDGNRADLLLLATDDALLLADLRDQRAVVQHEPGLDSSRGQARVVVGPGTATPIGDADAARAAVDLLRVALSVEAVGAARHCLDLTVAHLKTRQQFGRPLGSFQALQHRAADLVVALESAAATAYYAAWAAAAAPDELPVVAPLALSVCGEAAWRIAAETIQMHGGIGFTWEHDAHRYFKRLTTTRLVLGDAHVQRRLVAQRAAIAPAPAAR